MHRFHGRGRTAAGPLQAGRCRRKIGAVGRKTSCWPPWVGWGLSPLVVAEGASFHNHAETRIPLDLANHLGQASAHPKEAMISIKAPQPTGPQLAVLRLLAH